MARAYSHTKHFTRVTLNPTLTSGSFLVLHTSKTSPWKVQCLFFTNGMPKRTGSTGSSQRKLGYC